MPRDVNGTYTLPTNDSSPAAPRNVIRSSDFNELTGDYATALTDSLSRSGDGAMLSDLDMGGFDVLNSPKITKTTDVNPRLDSSGQLRGYLARDLEKPISIEEFGDYVNSSADHTALVQAAMNSAFTTILVPIGKTYNINNTVTLSSVKKIVGGGGSTFKSQRVDRTFPMFVIAAAATGASVFGVTFDHNAQGVPEPSLANALSLALLSPLLCMADNAVIDNCSFLNSWDNGLGIGRYTYTGDGSVGSPYSTTQTTGSPKNVRVKNSYAYNCGIGDHVTGTPGRIGVGINVLTGSQIIVEGCVADFCHTGFATDFGGGAGATFNGCISSLARQNAAGTNGGIGFYIADGPVTLNGCQALHGDGIGFEIPQEANGTSLSSCYAFANKRQGFLVGSSYTTLTGCIAQDNSFGNSNTYDAFYLNPYAENMIAVQLIGCIAFGTYHRYGWSSDAGAAFGCDASIIGGQYNGVSGEGNKAGKNIAYLNTSLGRVRANPLGGMMEILGSWDNPFKLFNGYMFADDVGRIRYKFSGTAPTSVTDGQAIGDQTATGGSVSVNDDAFVTITPPATSGIFKVWTVGAVNLFGEVYFRASDGAVNLGYKGSLVDLLPATVPTGTTGVDTHLTICSSGGNLYVENRTGGTRTIGYRFDTV